MNDAGIRELLLTGLRSGNGEAWAERRDPATPEE